jgi:hypothetical protein
LYGLEAISANNGWAMAVAGAIIVMSGLTVLSFVIAQIHKILILWENRGQYFKRSPKLPQRTETEEEQDSSIRDHFATDIHQTARLYEPLIEQLNDPFQLADLYQLSREKGFPHPHLTITKFQQANILVPRGDGFFSWNQPQDN